MKFYNRTSEIVELQKMKGMAYKEHSKLTVLVERRRIGKTLLILNALKDESLIYLFFVFGSISREQLLANKIEVINDNPVLSIFESDSATA